MKTMMENLVLCFDGDIDDDFSPTMIKFISNYLECDVFDEQTLKKIKY